MYLPKNTEETFIILIANHDVVLFSYICNEKLKCRLFPQLLKERVVKFLALH